MKADKPPQPAPLCPICKTAKWVEAYRPFCSKRCADIDLHRWLSGAYTIPATEPPDEWELEVAEKEEQGIEGQDEAGQAQDEMQDIEQTYYPTDEKPELH